MDARDVVFFLGAGFSRHAGLPTTKEFGAESAKHLERLAKVSRFSMPMFLQAGEVFREFQEYCRKAATCAEIDSSNVEDVFCMADVLEATSMHQIALPGGPCAIRHVLDQIRLWLWKIYQSCPPLDYAESTSDYKRLAGPYLRFFEVLSRHLKPGQVTVISTNYDLILEHFGWRSGFPCAYPEGPSEIHVGGRPEKYLGHLPESVRVCKLHGSVNLFDFGRGRDVRLAVDVAKAGDHIGKSVAPTDRPAVFALDALWAIRRKQGTLPVPAIVPPTYAKIGGDDWLRRVWYDARDALQRCRTLAFIGYSLPRSDGFMTSMIQAAMALRESPTPPNVYVVDPDAHDGSDLRNRYRGLFGPISEKLTFVPKAFAEAVDHDLERIVTTALP